MSAAIVAALRAQLFAAYSEIEALRSALGARQADGERRRRKPCPYCGRPRSRRARMCLACHNMIGRGV